jgi:uncharacterized OB-fold protein
MCPRCGGTDTAPVDASGRGTVYSYAILHHPQAPQFDYPVLAALVDLEEGTRLLTDLVEVAPQDVRIGMAVSVTFLPTVDAWAVPVFRPAGDAR